MTILELYNKTNELGKKYILFNYSVRAYCPYTLEDIFSDKSRILKMFLDENNKEEFVLLDGDDFSIEVYLWNTKASKKDLSICEIKEE